MKIERTHFIHTHKMMEICGFNDYYILKTVTDLYKIVKHLHFNLRRKL